MNTGVGCHFLLQGIFPTQALNLCLLKLLQRRPVLYHLAPGKPLVGANVSLFGRSFPNILMLSWVLGGESEVARWVTEVTGWEGLGDVGC